MKCPRLLGRRAPGPPDHLLPGGRKLALDAGRPDRLALARGADGGRPHPDHPRHFDHVKDLPLLADLLVGRRRPPVGIHASRKCARTLRDERLQRRALARLHPHPRPEAAGDRDPPVPAPEAVPRRPLPGGARPRLPPRGVVGYVLSDGKASVVFTGDTGPTDAALAARQRGASGSRRSSWSSASRAGSRRWPTSPATSRPRRSPASSTKIDAGRAAGPPVPPQAGLHGRAGRELHDLRLDACGSSSGARSSFRFDVPEGKPMAWSRSRRR